MSSRRLLIALTAVGTATAAATMGSTIPGEESLETSSGLAASAMESQPASGMLSGSETLQAMGRAYDGLYHFTRIQFSGGGRGGFGGFGRRRGGGVWAHDYPRADHNFLAILEETTNVRTNRESSTVLTLDDPELFRHPISYIVEPGFWSPSDDEVTALGEYLLKGGFLIVDDFRGPYELDNLQFHLRRALPDLDMIMLDEDHEIFDSFFRIVPDEVVPPYGGYPPAWYGIFEDNDPTKRLMVVINANNDIAEYWEFSDYGYLPIDLANEAYKLGVNYVVYALTH